MDLHRDGQGGAFGASGFGDAHDANFVHAAKTVSRSVDFGGFTGALRKAGQMGALARARALLDGLTAMEAGPTAG